MTEMTGKSGKVYVANVTAQNHTLNFSVPDSRKPLSITLPMGQQKFVGDFDAPTIDAMVAQLGPYGLVELGQEDRKKKVTYIFSVGGPVPASAMQKIYDRNRGILTAEGKQRRIESAVAANTVMNTAETPLKAFTSEVEEVDPGDLGSDSDNVGEGVKIDSSLGGENRPPRRSRRGG